ncbi:hypothetical protein SLOPH_597 [Spraguea lophii 42_110]|uniref:Uncharacterized protein n=1 Tax=Spraguea lophii (strain 42_110) TaxID=1358809 RepID=S7XV82_SPRLO|nr:hypothetical protein SLOPH_597 [Spraguea lophii 42_110]
MFLLQIYLLPIAFIFSIMWIITFIESSTAQNLETLIEYYFPNYQKPYLLLFFIVATLIFIMNQFFNKKRYANFVLFQLTTTMFIGTLTFAPSFIQYLSITSNMSLLISYILYMLRLKGTAAYFNLSVILSNIFIFAFGLNNSLYNKYLIIRKLYLLSGIW